MHPTLPKSRPIPISWSRKQIDPTWTDSLPLDRYHCLAPITHASIPSFLITKVVSLPGFVVVLIKIFLLSNNIDELSFPQKRDPENVRCTSSPSQRIHIFWFVAYHMELCWISMCCVWIRFFVEVLIFFGPCLDRHFAEIPWPISIAVIKFRTMSLKGTQKD